MIMHSKEEIELSLEITRIESALSKVASLAVSAKFQYLSNY